MNIFTMFGTLNRNKRNFFLHVSPARPRAAGLSYFTQTPYLWLMVRTITPFNLLPIYSGLPDRAARAGLYCPTTKGPMFQFYRAGGLAVNSFETYNAATGSATTQDAAQIEVSETATGTFFTYKGDTLDVAMSQGQEYHFRVTLSDDTVYYSHLLCPLSAFDAAAITLAGAAVTAAGAIRRRPVR